MRKVPTGTKIVAQTDIGQEFATILEHQPSQYSEDVYLVKWGDGSQTLIELTRDNLFKEKKVKSKKKQTN